MEAGEILLGNKMAEYSNEASIIAGGTSDCRSRLRMATDAVRVTSSNNSAALLGRFTSSAHTADAMERFYSDLYVGIDDTDDEWLIRQHGGGGIPPEAMAEDTDRWCVRSY